ncbi:Short-chain dehydrogenase/reductase SDR [Ilyonectria robusta]
MVRTFLPMQLSTRDSIGGLCTIINVSSSGALTARPGSGSYRSSKLAILRWTETLQIEYADQGLLTFCVNPGAIKTQMSKELPEKMRNLLPDRPDIAGDTIVWLAAERKEWLGGRYISCPWDMQELSERKDEIIKKDKLKMRMCMESVRLFSPSPAESNHYYGGSLLGPVGSTIRSSRSRRRDVDFTLWM